MPIDSDKALDVLSYIVMICIAVLVGFGVYAAAHFIMKFW